MLMHSFLGWEAIDATKQENDALRKFRPRAVNLCLHDEEMLDENLLKWLRARDLNVREAEEMLRKAMIWRKENKMDKILDWQPPSEFLQEFPYDMDGEDREGHPVFTIPLGKWDIHKAYVRGHRKQVHRYLEQLLERCIEKTRLKNLTDPADKFINQGLFIWDFEGFSMKQMTSSGMVDSIRDFVKTVEGIYPEIVKTSIVVNAPRIFGLFFAMMKPLISPRTLSKVHIYGSNTLKWKAFLRTMVAEEQLLEHYGGFRTVNTHFNEAKNRKNSFIDDDIALQKGMCAVTVHPKEQVKVALDIKTPNTLLNWRFYTDAYDIGFSVEFEDKNLTILNKGRVDSHLEIQEGSLKAVIPGRYSLVFDNTYSMIRAKTLHHHISEIRPVGDTDEHTTWGVVIKD